MLRLPHPGRRIGWFCLVLSAALLGVPAARAQTFTDVTVFAGLTHEQYPSLLDLYSAPYHTGGVVAADYDDDGWIDLYFTVMDGPDVLYHNKGDGTFEVVSPAASGIDRGNGSNGAAWADIENDGDLDLFVTAVEQSRTVFLYVNNGYGTFTEEGVARGVETGSDSRMFSTTLGDYDKDGYLDLHVESWLDFDAEYNLLFHNKGDAQPGYFIDVTDSAGVRVDSVVNWEGGMGTAFGFGSHFADLDGDGWCDLVMTSDVGTSRLFWNNGDGTFTDGTDAAGVGTDENGMGSTAGDFDGDGLLDLFVTAIYDPDTTHAINGIWGATGNRLYKNQGGRVFSDVTDAYGVRNGGWGWGTSWIDYDNDADLDLVMTNGWDHPGSTAEDIFNRFPMRLWRNDGGAPFTEVAFTEGLVDSGQGRGLLTFDYDNDGDLDIVFARNKTTPVLYRNDSNNGNGWLEVRLVGVASNIWGIGSRIRLVAGGVTQIREVTTGPGFLAQGPMTAWFGLGSAAEVDTIEIRWPSGTVQTLACVETNQRTVVVESATPTAIATGLDAEFVGSEVAIRWYVCETEDIDAFNLRRRVNASTFALVNDAPIVPVEGTMNYLDNPPQVTSRAEYAYRLEAVLKGGGAVTIGEVSLVRTVPSGGYRLYQNVPNPFNPTTSIGFELPVSSHVELYVFTVDGRRVRTLAKGVFEGGPQVVEWDGLDAAGNPVGSGIYFYQLRTSTGTLTRKMVLVR